MLTKRKNNKIKSVLAFTLIELIIVIAIVVILASIVVVVVNPSVAFQKARNSTRSSDIGTLQGAITRYLSESSITALPRTLKDLSGYASLYASATSSSPSGNCPGGANGTGLVTLTTAYSLDTISTSQNSILLTPLLNGGYISRVPQDPLTTTSYRACIDTSSNNQLVIYSNGIENGASMPVATLGTYNPTVVLWDSFNRSDASSIGAADSGQTWATTFSGAGSTGISSNQMLQSQPGTNTSLVDSGIANANLKVTLATNVAGNFGLLFRASDVNNYWYFGQNGSATVRLIQFLGGAQVFAQSTAIVNNTANPLNATLEVIYSGQSIICKYNGAVVLSYTDTTNFNITSTKVGLFTLGLNIWDNFTVTNP